MTALLGMGQLILLAGCVPEPVEVRFQIQPTESCEETREPIRCLKILLVSARGGELCLEENDEDFPLDPGTRRIADAHTHIPPERLVFDVVAPRRYVLFAAGYSTGDCSPKMDLSGILFCGDSQRVRFDQTMGKPVKIPATYCGDAARMQCSQYASLRPCL